MNVGHTSDKQGVLERLLDLGMVLVAFDARARGVEVPHHLARDPQLRLNLSYRFGRPLKIDAWGVDAELTFGGVPHACRVPLAAIYLIISHVNGEPFLFPDDVPPELLNQASGALEGLAKTAAPERRRPKLSVVAGADEASDDDDDEPTALKTDKPATKKAAPRSAAQKAESDAEPDAVSEGDAEAQRPPKQRASSTKPRRRGHLRVIK